MLIIVWNVSLCVLNGMSVALICFNINTLSLSYQFLVTQAGMTAIHHAAMNNHVTIVDSLVSCSVPVDINDNGGCTPLWWAACNGDVCCVDVLLKLGASPLHER